MNTKLLLCCIFLLSLPPGCAKPPIEEGVYTLYGREKIPAEQRGRTLQTTILELKDGRFSYWFSSDLKSVGEPHYPVTGTYTAKGGTLTMEIQTASISFDPGQPPLDTYRTEEWKVMKYDGQIILWPLKLLGPPVAGPPPPNVLVRTNRHPEEIWKEETKRK